jgi:hypothetical protein
MAFPAHQNKEEALQALRDGATVEEVIGRFGISERTAWRYFKEAQDPKPPETRRPGSNRDRDTFDLRYAI